MPSMASIKVRRRNTPALVGRSEAAAILKVAQQNLRRMADMPEPLNERGIKNFAVSSGPVWVEAEIRELAEKREKAGR